MCAILRKGLALAHTVVRARHNKRLGVRFLDFLSCVIIAACEHSAHTARPSNHSRHSAKNPTLMTSSARIFWALRRTVLNRGRKGKSIYNKLAALSQVMKQHGRPKLLKAADWPSFVETIQPIYKDFELAKLFNACTRPEEVRFKFYLMSGFRDAEGQFVTWRDVDFKHMAVRVTSQPYWACLCLTRCRVEPSGDQLGSRGLAKSQAVILDSGLRAWDSLHQ
jgi:hypothetical protein